MFVQVTLQLGFGQYTRLGSATIDLASTDITTVDIHTEATHSGSFHILSMGQHFYEYVIDADLPAFRTDQSLPPAHPYVHLAGKLRDAGVTGNIGEAVASIVACRFMHLGPLDIAHVKPNTPFARRRSPDYLMRVGTNPSWISDHWMCPGTAPQWWPVESKARSTVASSDSAITDAYGQLVAYWHTVHQQCPDHVGYGIVVSFAYNNPRRILVAVFLPDQQQQLVDVFRRIRYDAIMANPLRLTRRYVHGC